MNRLCTVIQDGAPDRWLVFGAPLHTFSVSRLVDVLPALAAIEHAVAHDGLWAVGYIAYDAAPAFDAALCAQSGGAVPLLRFSLCHAPRVASASPFAQKSSIPQYRWTASDSERRYDERIAGIRALIAAGDTYQVNYTLRLTAPVCEPAAALFARMVAANRPLYSAWLDGAEFAVASASPELFFALDGTRIESKPMKGTIARGRWGAEDVQQRARLQQSAKDRAENLMIVDMLRNDLGRIARRGSVAVPDLFAIERYPTVWQMTSTVTAETGAPYTDIFRALFPAASITGAPKVRASAIVADAESTPRGLYTGAIGYLAPYRRARFNVAIRTAVIDPAHVTYGVGGGIVWDSTSRAEYQECLLKARIVTDAPPPFALLETLLWEAGTGYFLLAEHLQRLRATADYMDIAIDPARIRACLDDAVALPPAMRLRVRLLVDGAGIPSASASNLAPDSGAPVRVGLAREAIRRSNPFLYHKTTHRTWYDAAHAARPDCDDVILWNQDGEVTESTIANVVVECRGRHVTPPVRCGLLPGVMRQVLLARGEIEERVVTVAELRRARRVYLINSVRQWRDAVLVEPAP